MLEAVNTCETWQRPVQKLIALGAVGATVILTVGHLLTVIQSGSFVSSYRASGFWVSYSDGFIRRGLPGEIFKIVTGGSPTVMQASVLAVSLLLAAAIALVVLVKSVGRAIERPDDILLVIAIVIASPFTFSLLVRVIGRYDNIGLVVMAAIAVLSLGGKISSTNRLVRAGIICVLVAVATASEEVLFAFVAPLAVLGLYRLGWGGWRLLLIAIGVVAPGAVLASLSVLLRPPMESLVSAIVRAGAAGISVDLVHENAISSLGQTAAQGLDFFLRISPLTLAKSLVLFAGIYLLSVTMMWFLTRRSAGRLAWVLIATFGFAALLISAVGHDYRRWWALAFVAVVASMAILAQENTVPAASAVHPVQTLLVCAALILSVRLQSEPIWPKWDPVADAGFSIEHLARLDPNWR